MGYKLYEKLMAMLEDKNFSRSLKRRLISGYYKSGLLTKEERGKLVLTYVFNK